MAKTRYYRNTIGLNTEVVVAANVAYTANADYKTFIEDDGNEGEIGIFDAATGELLTAALEEGTKYFFAQKRDKGTHKSSEIVYYKADTKKIAYTAPVKQTTRVLIAESYVPKRFDEVTVSIIETTPGYQPFPRWTYSVSVKAGETLVQVIERLAALINDPNNVINEANGRLVQALFQPPAMGLALVALYEGACFRVALQEKAFEHGTVTTVDAFKQGSGYPDHVKELELAGNIFEGNTTQYPNQNATNEEFGTPTKFTSPTGTYNIYQIADTRKEKSPTPIEQHNYFHNLTVAIPVGKSTTVDTVLGF